MGKQIRSNKNGRVIVHALRNTCQCGTIVDEITKNGIKWFQFVFKKYER